MKNQHHRNVLISIALTSVCLLSGCSAKKTNNPPTPEKPVEVVSVKTFTDKTTSHKLMGKCPISGAWVRDNEVQGELLYNNQTYYFCTENCKDIFKELHPEAKEVK